MPLPCTIIINEICQTGVLRQSCPKRSFQLEIGTNCWLLVQQFRCTAVPWIFCLPSPASSGGHLLRGSGVAVLPLCGCLAEEAGVGSCTAALEWVPTREGLGSQGTSVYLKHQTGSSCLSLLSVTKYT